MTNSTTVQEWEQFSAYRKLIRAAKADAWDECHRYCFATEDGDPYNPYREEQ